MLTVDDRLRAAAAEVRAVVDEYPVPALQPEPGTRPAPVFPWRRGVAVLVAAIIVALLAVGGILLLLRSSTEEPPVVTTLPPTTTTVAPETTTTAPETTTAAPETSTTTAPETSTTTTEAPQAASITWTRIDSDAFADFENADIATGGPGLVAIGNSGAPPDRFIALVSPDGESWERVADIAVEPDIWLLSDLAVGPAGFVAVGQSGTDAAVFHSPDGSAWQQIFDEDLTSGTVQAMWGVTAWGDGFVTVGAVGDDAGVWVSEDGLEWIRVEHEAFVAAEGEGQAHAYDVAAGPSGLVVIGYLGFWDPDPDAAMWMSVDGVDWERQVFPQDSAFEAVERDPSRDLMLAFGRGSIWSSTDGLAWDEISDGGGIWAGSPPPSSGVAWFDGVVVAGGLENTTSLWLSRDDGVGWLRLGRDDPAFAGDAILDVTAFGSKAVAVGRSSVWIGEFTD